MSLRTALSLAGAPALGFGLLGMVWGTFAVQIPALKLALGVGDALFGMLLLCGGSGLLLAMRLAPRLEQWKRGRALPWAYRLLGLCFPLPALAAALGGDWAWLLFALVLVLLGLCSGLVDILMNAQVSALENRHDRPLMNAAHGTFSAAYGVAALAAGVVRAAGVPPVASFAVVGAVLFAMAYKASNPRAVGPRTRPGAPRAPFVPEAVVAACGMVVLLAFAAEHAVESWSALFIERVLGAGPAAAALGPAMLGLTMAVGRFGGQVVTDRLGEPRMLLSGSVLACLGALAVALSPGALGVYLGFAALGFGVAAIGPVGIAMAGRAVPRGRRTVAVAQATAIGFGGIFLAPILIGAISEGFGLRAAFGTMGLLLLLVPMMARIGRRPIAA